MGNYALPSFASGPQIPMAMTGLLQSLPQVLMLSSNFLLDLKGCCF